MDDEAYNMRRGLWNTLFLQGAKVEVFADVKNHNEFMVDPALNRTVALIEHTYSQ
jgi:hypothetical protein